MQVLAESEEENETSEEFQKNQPLLKVEDTEHETAAGPIGQQHKD